MKRLVSRLVGLADDSGQALVIVALCLTCLMGFVALATDVGTLFHAKRELQIAADAAAIAGAAELGYTDLTTSAAAQAAATQNGVTNNENGATVTVNNPPAYGPYGPSNGNPGNANYVEVIVSRLQPTIFMQFFMNSPTISARAVATNGAGSGCMYLTGTSGADIQNTGTGSLDVPDCGILDDSGSADAIQNTGTGSITAKSIGVVAAAPGYQNTGTGSVTTPTADMAPVSDPLASLPEPTVPSNCTAFSATGTKPATLTQGCYSSISITGTGNVTFQAGTYILTGPVQFTGTGSITGSGVTFYLASSASSISITGTQPVTLSAPTSGTYNGILFFQERGDTHTFSVTGTGNLNLTGIFYIPSGTLDLTGTGNATYDAAFVASKLEMTGTGNVTLDDYALTNTGTPLTSVRLVE